jgi:hypothetical protein
MKKYALIVAVLVLSVCNFIGFLTQSATANNGGGLTCNQLIGCGGNIRCAGKGTPAGCSITCEDGAFISCQPLD